MNVSNAKIKTVIIDDDKNLILSLQDQLSFFPEIEVIGYATQYKQSKNLIINEKPDLIFLDIEMSVKNGFELLDEIRKESHFTFHVIFHTAYDKYVIQALRASAFDYLLKPVDEKDLKETICRFKENRIKPFSNLSEETKAIAGISEIIPLPTNTGLKFVDKHKIVLFQCIKESFIGKSYWEATMNNFDKIRLGNNTSAKQILTVMGKDKFIQINQLLFALIT